MFVPIGKFSEYCDRCRENARINAAKKRNKIQKLKNIIMKGGIEKNGR